MNTYVFAIKSEKYNDKLITVEETSREKAVQKAKAKCFPDVMTKRKRVATIHNMFVELGYSFGNSLMIQGTDYKITEFKK